MEFELMKNERGVAITNAALAMSSIVNAGQYGMFTLPNAVVVMAKHMTAKELFAATVSLRLLAGELLMQLAKSCRDICEDCDNSCIEDMLANGVEASCMEYATKFKPFGNTATANAHDIVEAVYDEFIARGYCVRALFEHYVNEDIVYGK